MPCTCAISLSREHASGTGADRADVAIQSLKDVGRVGVLTAAAEADRECLIYRRLRANCIADVSVVPTQQHLFD